MKKLFLDLLRGRFRAENKPILLVDFDGVIHSYRSGWQGARSIPDPPVPGAIVFLIRALERFDVCIYSSRSRQWGGKRAMKKWLRFHFGCLANRDFETWPEEISAWMTVHSYMEPYPHDVVEAAHALIKAIRWPTKKPAAFLTIDDRAHCFTGVFPDVEGLLDFKPWNKLKR